MVINKIKAKTEIDKTLGVWKNVFQYILLKFRLPHFFFLASAAASSAAFSAAVLARDPLYRSKE